MLSNAYFLAKIRFDTAENEPAKKLQKFAIFAKSADPNRLMRPLSATFGTMRPSDRSPRRRRGLRRPGGLGP